MTYQEWLDDHNAKLDAAAEAGDVAEMERLMTEDCGFGEIDWEAENK